MVYCLNCGSSIDEYDGAYYARSMLCIPCFNRKQSEASARSCSRCGRSIRTDESKSHKGLTYCSYCFSEIQRLESAIFCSFCKKQIMDWEEKSKMPDGKYCCAKCRDSSAGKSAPKLCSMCKKPSPLKFIGEDGTALCMECANKSPSTRAQMHAQSQPRLSLLVGRIRSMLS